MFNPSDRDVDVSGWAFTDGVAYTIPADTIIGPGQFLVVAQDPAEMNLVFGTGGGPVVAYQVPAGTVGNQNFGGSLGMDFVVNAPIQITDLGAFDSNSDGVSLTLTTELWSRNDGGTPNDPHDDSGITVLASETFTPVDPGTLVGGSRLKPLAVPLVLQPGAYTIAAHGYGASELLLNNGVNAAGSIHNGGGRISFVGLSRWGDNVNAFPSTIGANLHEFGAGTFRFEGTEPGAAIEVLGSWDGKLANDGENVTLRNAAGGVVDRVDYRMGFPWPVAPAGQGPSMELLHPAIANDLGGSWRSSGAWPTPGVENAVRTDNAPPRMRQVAHTPKMPTSSDDVTVTAKITDLDGVAGVTLEIQLVDPGSYIGLTDAAYQTDWIDVSMNDSGVAGDAVAGDGVYSASLPAALQMHRRLVRYRITAVDTFGISVTAPLPDDPQPNFAYFVYDGVPDWTGSLQPGVEPDVAYGGDVMNSLPIYQLISDEADILACQYTSANDKVYRFEGTLVYDGEVYDHIHYRIRGQNSTRVVGKNKWKLKFNEGHYFEWHDDFGNPFAKKVDSINFTALAVPWAPPNFGMAGLDEAVSLRLWNMAGVPAANTASFQLRIIDDAVETDPTNQYEGDLWGLYMALEEADGKFLDEHGMPDGNLFKMQSGATRLIHNGAAQPTNLADVHAFTSAATGYNRTGPIQPVTWWRDNVDLDGYYSYRSVMEAVNHNDQRDQENSIYFRDPDTGQWSILPWDVDLLYEQFDRWGPDGTQNHSAMEQIRKSLEHDEINIEFQNRARELQDLLLNDDQGRQVVWEYAEKVAALAAVDGAMWNYNPRTTTTRGHRGAYWSVDAYNYSYPPGQTRQALPCPTSDPGCSDFDKLTNYVAQFIATGGFGGDQLAVLHDDANIPETPTIITDNVTFPQNAVALETSAFADPNGAGTFAAMQWRVGEVTDPGAPAYDPAAPIIYEIGAVWESGELTEFDDTIDVPGHDLEVGHAYRARVRMQDDTGRWSHWSDERQFVVIDPLPSDVSQYLRVGEIMYNPADPAATGPEAAFTDNDDFEFIELVNTSDTETLDISGVSLTDGIDFTFSAGTHLAPGERILAVRNLAAFTARYGTAGMNVAGEYRDPVDDGNKLSNGGETIALTAAGGDAFLSFAYSDRALEGWPDAADGAGSSLEAVNLDSDPSLGQAWYASVEVGGTPGASATAAVLDRLAFYGNSAFDAVSADDAIASDKTALLPGAAATVANFTNFSGGVNGLIVDVANAASFDALSAADFVFARGNGDDPSTWAAALPAGIEKRPGEGRGGSDRIVLAWDPNDAVKNAWLGVTLQADPQRSGLPGDDVFYFGNAAGDVSGAGAPGAGLPPLALVNAADVVAIRDNPRGPSDPATIDDAHDVNRDRRVNAIDVILARNGATSPLSALKMIAPD